MSEIYNNSSELAALISAGAQELVNQAKALGLTWSLRLASVSVSTQDTQTAVFDGDTTPLTVTNMTGSPLVSGQRVYGLIIPPAGNFIISQASGTPDPIGVAASVTGQAVANSATTAATWTSTSFDVGGFMSSVPIGSFSIPFGMDGLYAVTANALLAASGTRNLIEATDNGSLWIRSYFATPERFCSVSGVKFLAAGTSVVVNVFQNSGAPTTMDANVWAYRIT